jgi:hypothetical protein
MDEQHGLIITDLIGAVAVVRPMAQLPDYDIGQTFDPSSFMLAFQIILAVIRTRSPSLCAEAEADYKYLLDCAYEMQDKMARQISDDRRNLALCIRRVQLAYKDAKLRSDRSVTVFEVGNWIVHRTNPNIAGPIIQINPSVLGSYYVVTTAEGDNVEVFDGMAVAATTEQRIPI